VPAKTYVLTEILDYVGTHAAQGSAFGISQSELARSLGYHRCSMSRPLAALVRDRRLFAVRGLVRGGQRKQIVYRLTGEGRELLERQTQDVPMLSADLPVPPRPFIGRREELRQLAVYSREPGTVIGIQGGPGMGKTALVAHHIRRLKHNRVPFWFTIRAGSSPRHFLEAISHALSQLGASQLAYYAQVPGSPSGREVANLAMRSLGEYTLLAVIDDTQTAGPDMRKFLSDFIAAVVSENKGLFVLVGQEPPFLPPDGPAVQRLMIGGLDRASAHELTDRQGGLADRFEQVYQSTMGSPLLLQLAVEAPGVEAEPGKLPQAVVARMAADEAKALLPVAIANEPLPVTFLTEFGGVSPTRVAELTQIGILHPTREGRVELLEAIRKALIIKAGDYEVEAHRQLASFYGRSHRPAAVRERLIHLVAGESWRAASDLLAQSSRVVLSQGYSAALREALVHMALAMPVGPGRIRALRVEAELLRYHSEYAEAIQVLRRAIADAEADERLIAECLLEIGELHVRLRQIDDARGVLEEARELGTPTNRLRIQLQFGEARLVEASGDLTRAQVMFSECFQAARKARITELALDSLAAWSRLSSLGGDQEEALRMVHAGIPEARLSARMDIVFNLMLVRARVYAETGRSELAEVEMRTIRSEAEQLGQLSQLTYTLSGLAAMAIQGERWEEAIDLARQANNLAERLGNEVVLGHTLALMASGEARRGQLDAARDHGERAVRVLSRLPPSDSLVLAHGHLAEIYVILREGGLAREEYRAASELATSMGMGHWRDQLELELKARIDALPPTP
jgi:tetratricopeptide (TPR) repeat protein/DNA-binding MarR family transcriptional regulator